MQDLRTLCLCEQFHVVAKDNVVYFTDGFTEWMFSQKRKTDRINFDLKPFMEIQSNSFQSELPV